MIRWLLLALCLVASSAQADGRMCLTRDVMLFGDQALGTNATQSAVMTNCGDAPFTLTEVSLHASTSPAFHVASTCVTGLSLAAGATCRIDVTFAPTQPGQVSGGVWLYNTTSTGSQLITFYGRGIDASAGSATLEITPSPLDFGPQAVGAIAPVRLLTLRNAGPSSLHFTALVINGPAAYDFDFAGNCAVGLPLPAGRSCQLAFTFTPAALGTRPAQLNIDAPELARLTTVAIRGTGVVTTPAVAPPAVDVVEFYNAPLNHYFLTANPDEAAAIDRGAVGPNWVRTGLGFRAYAAGTSGSGTVDVCRFFGTPGVGPSSHFFTGNAAECAAVRINPNWFDEGIAFRAILPAAGVCPAGSTPVLRFFWPGGMVLASRHRYASDPATIAALRAAAPAWIEEGPVFCSAP
jgi:hypothetical protein